MGYLREGIITLQGTERRKFSTHRVRGCEGAMPECATLVPQQFGKVVEDTRKEHWMTVAESVAKVTASLPPEKQQEVLDFVRLLKERKGARARVGQKGLTAAERKKLHPAVRAIAGIWKGRKDLPKDPVKAVKVLRSRMKSKGRHD
jgi:hypothetical protein